MVTKLRKPWLIIPPEWAHKLSPTILNLFFGTKPKENSLFHWNELQWEGLFFRNPAGTAGGLDKNALNIKAWWNLGAGFQELGTVTPLPQYKNKGKVVDRDVNLLALWNYLGFPNLGARHLKERLREFPKPNRITPLFINIGKNRWVENKDAHNDYIYLIETLKEDADAFVINISSPNTSGLRDLFSEDNFKAFIEPICNSASKLKAPPLILKLSPDLSEREIENIITATEGLPIKGWTLTNTTKWRSFDMTFDRDKGGVSGKPLASKSENFLIHFQDKLGSRRGNYLIISAGGIFSKQDIQRRLDLGADLTQMYSCLIFEGPYFFKHLVKENKI